MIDAPFSTPRTIEQLSDNYLRIFKADPASFLSKKGLEECDADRVRNLGAGIEHTEQLQSFYMHALEHLVDCNSSYPEVFARILNEKEVTLGALAKSSRLCNLNCLLERGKIDYLLIMMDKGIKYFSGYSFDCLIAMDKSHFTKEQIQRYHQFCEIMRVGYCANRWIGRYLYFLPLLLAALTGLAWMKLWLVAKWVCMGYHALFAGVLISDQYVRAVLFPSICSVKPSKVSAFSLELLDAADDKKVKEIDDMSQVIVPDKSVEVKNVQF